MDGWGPAVCGAVSRGECIGHAPPTRLCPGLRGRLLPVQRGERLGRPVAELRREGILLSAPLLRRLLRRGLARARGRRDGEEEEAEEARPDGEGDGGPLLGHEGGDALEEAVLRHGEAHLGLLRHGCRDGGSAEGGGISHREACVAAASPGG